MIKKPRRRNNDDNDNDNNNDNDNDNNNDSTTTEGPSQNVNRKSDAVSEPAAPARTPTGPWCRSLPNPPYPAESEFSAQRNPLVTLINSHGEPTSKKGNARTAGPGCRSPITTNTTGAAHEQVLEQRLETQPRVQPACSDFNVNAHHPPVDP